MLNARTLLTIYVASLLIEGRPILKIKYRIQFFNLSLHKVNYCRFISFLLHEVTTLDLALAFDF
jgi:hypothetical protein